MFRPPIVAIFREVIFEGHITWDVQTICKYKMLSCKYNCLKSMLKHEVLIMLLVLNCVFMCCIYGDTIQAVVMCLMVALYGDMSTCLHAKSNMPICVPQ